MRELKTVEEAHGIDFACAVRFFSRFKLYEIEPLWFALYRELMGLKPSKMNETNL